MNTIQSPAAVAARGAVQAMSRFRPLKTAIAVAMVFGMPLAHAQEEATFTETEVTETEVIGGTEVTTEAELSTITVSASADASAAGLSKPLAGGQVARGGRAGILGTRDQMELPVSVTSYTNQLILDQQAQSVADVLLNDPSVRTARGFGNFQEAYYVRGFLLDSDDIAYNGLYGLLPRQYIASELFERVEMLRGASAFLNGSAPNGRGLGGTVNLLPKRATNQALNRVEVGVQRSEQFNLAGDFSRRFGPDGDTGLRINANHRQGGTGVDDEDVKLDLISAGLDWRNARTRLSADIGYQNHRLEQARTNVTPGSALTLIPSAPDSTTNWAQPWSYSKEKDTFGTVRGEYDFNDAITGWFALGSRQGKEDNSLGNVTLTDNSGAGSFYRFDNQRKDNIVTGEMGARGKFETGSVSHEVVVSYSAYQGKSKNAYAFDFGNQFETSIYNPIRYAQPAWSDSTVRGNWDSGPALTTKTRLSSIAIGDTLGFMDNSLLVTLGARHQTLKQDTYAYNTGALESSYDKSHVSPMLGVVYKLPANVSLYANYLEGLSQGETASGVTNSGAQVRNYGERLDPYVAKQKEVGVKWDAGRAIYGLALFTTDRPRSMVNADDYFVSDGKDRHQGAELTVQGEPIRGLRMLGGLTLLDAKQKQTGVDATNGKRVIGVPKHQLSLSLDWDTPWVEGLSADARVIRTGSVYADSENALEVPSWTRIDLGVRYLMDIQGKLVTLRARVDNVADRKYWASSGGYPNAGYLVQGGPRTFSLSASMEF